MKKKSKFPLVFAAFVVFVATIYFFINEGSKASPEAELDFANANSLLTQSKPEAAIEEYEELLSKGDRNATLYYNLGSAHHEAGHLGQAVLNYEKAKSLDPRGSDIDTALSKARRDSGSTVLRRPFFKILTVDEWTILSALALLAVAVLIVVRPSQMFVSVLLTSLICFGLTSTAVFMSESWSKGRVVVVQGNTSLRVSPFEQARKIVALPPGENLVLEGAEQNGYQLVRLSSGEVGWLQEAGIATITDR